MSKYNLYLGDILRSIELIESSGLNKRIKYPDFVSDRNLFDATTMRLQIIGESMSKLPKRILRSIREADINRFMKTRNIVSHAYFAIKPEIIWDIAVQDIPKLKKGIIKLLKNEK